jgi:hypothetical protein
MVAALLLAATSDGAELVKSLNEYGRATVADALAKTDTASGEVIELPTRKSGRR